MTGKRTAVLFAILNVIVLAVLGALLLRPELFRLRTTKSSCPPDLAGSPTDELSIAPTSPGVKLPQLEPSRVMTGQLPAAMLKAMPAHWLPVGLLYQTGVCGNSVPVSLRAPAPPDATSEQLDLITWNGAEWQWLGGPTALDTGRLTARLNALPANVMVVRAVPVAPLVSAETLPGMIVHDRVMATIDEVVVPAFLIVHDGSLQGDPAALPAPVGATQSMFAASRNWSPDGSVNVGVVSDVLSHAELRAAHVKAITEAVLRARYAGAMVDYRGVPSDLRATFSRFVADLAASLHKNNRKLVVVVPAPIQRGDEWDTAGYNWQAIGASADIVQIDAPADPAAYNPGRQVEAMLRWAVRQVNRSKMQIALPASSIKQTGKAIQLISAQDALKPLKVVTTTTGSRVMSGSQVKLSLSNPQGIEYDESTRTYRYTVAASDDVTSTIWLNTGAALEYKLNLAIRFGLRGVMFKGLLSQAQEPTVWTAVERYKAQFPAQVSSRLQVTWSTSDTEGTHLFSAASVLNTAYVWTAPDAPGEYTLRAALPGSAAFAEIAINVDPAKPESGPTRAQDLSVLQCPDAALVANAATPTNLYLDKNKEFVKTWWVRNTGSCAWPAGTIAAFASGDRLEAPESVSIGSVQPGQTITLDVKIKSPDKDGSFRALWRLMDDRGKLFGEPLTVTVLVGQPWLTGGSHLAGSFELGGQVDGFAFPAQMHDAGMTWVKHQMRWSPGMSPDDYAAVIDDSRLKGFKVLLSVLGSPESSQPTFFPAYAAFVGGLAGLKSPPDAIEIWNEENIDREWQAGQISAAAYTELLKQAYTAIKKANPNVMVISGALAPTGAFNGCGPSGCDDAVFLNGMAAAGAADYMDCVGVHYNSGIISPNETSGDPRGPHYTWYFWGMVNMHIITFAGARPLCFTELGYLTPAGYGRLPSQFAWAQNTTVEQQAQWLAEAASLSIKSGIVRLMIVWNVDYIEYGEDPMAGYAIIRPVNSCPACEALRAVVKPR